MAVVPGLLDAARVARLREIADGLRERYVRRDPVTGRRGFLASGWSISHIEHPGFFDDAPEWWFPEVAGLLADPAILDLWRTATGEEPHFAAAALYVDPLMPYAVDSVMRQMAAPDGAGSWHRDRTGEKPDDVERAELLDAGRLPEGGHLLEIALLASDAFEYVPGSHARWDTPEELTARRRGTELADWTRPLPGARRPTLAPGDGLLADTSGIHRGWYTHGVTRRTITLVYSSMERLERYPDDIERPRCFLEPRHLEGLRPDTRAYFENQLQHSLAWT